MSVPIWERLTEDSERRRDEHSYRQEQATEVIRTR